MSTWGRGRRLLLLAAALGGCSPYPYDKSSNTLSEAFTSLRGIYGATAEQLRVTRNLVDRTTWVLDRPKLDLLDCGNRRQNSGRCRVVPAAQSAELREAGSRAPLIPDQSPAPGLAATREDACVVVGSPEFVRGGFPKMDSPRPEAAKGLSVDEVFDAFSDYTGGLSAITKASDRAAFDAAADQVSSALGSLMATAGAAAGQPAMVAAAPVVKATANGVLWLVGTGLDHQRYETLKASVIAACRPVRTLARALPFVLAVPLGDLRDTDKQLVERRLSLLNARRSRSASSDQVYGQIADELLAAVDSFNAQGEDPGKLTGDIIRAHDELVLAVWRNKGQLAAAEKAMAKLDEHVAAIRKAAGAAAAAGTKGGT